MLQQLQHITPMRNCRALPILDPARELLRLSLCLFLCLGTHRALPRGMSWPNANGRMAHPTPKKLVPSFRTSPPGSESYCPACSIHTHGQESSRWAQGLTGDRAGGSDLTLRCWSWFSVSIKADQLNCIDFCQRLPRAWGTDLPRPVRAPLILERSSPELLISIRKTFTKSG